MSSYSAWEKKATALCEEVDKEEERERSAADEQLGLSGEPMGPPVAAAGRQRRDMAECSRLRAEMLARQAAREVVFEETGPAAPEEPLLIEDVDNKAIRFLNCNNRNYVLAQGQAIVKLFVTNCSEVKIHLRCRVKTSFVEIDRSSDVEITTDHALATVQCDELSDGPVRIVFQEEEDLGNILHQNCPGLEVAIAGQKPRRLGRAGARQFISKPTVSGEYKTEAVRRGEREFPVNVVEATVTSRSKQSQLSRVEEEEEELYGSRLQRAEERRLSGNSAFKANDFLQAAVHFTEAIELCEDLHIVWANRAQCWLKTGQPEKALTDATRCTELAPKYAKGWFRKGMALHALQLYSEAIPAFCEAEKLDPKNPQIPEAIKMAQLKCRQQASGE